MHIIIYDHTTRRIPRGFVIVFCAICRDATGFELTELRLVERLYLISLGKGKFIGNELRCCQCGLLLANSVEDLPTMSDREMEAEREAMEREPPAALLRRLELEAGVLECSLTAEARQWMVVEPFLIVEYHLQTKGRSTLERTAGVALISIALLVGTFISVGTQQPGVITAVLSAATGASALWFGRSFLNTTRSAARRHALPLVARSLRLVDPSLDELRDAMTAAAMRKSSAARALKPEQVLAAIRSLPSSA